MILHISNGRCILVCSIESLEGMIGHTLIPMVVLLTAWSEKEAGIDRWHEVLEFLANRGSMYFVCIGSFSEMLHDNLDDFLCAEANSFSKKFEFENVVTTYHSNDTLEDAVFYFSFLTPACDVDNSCYLAILDECSFDDKLIFDLLKNA